MAYRATVVGNTGGSTLDAQRKAIAPNELRANMEAGTSYAALFDTFPQAAWTVDLHLVMGDTGLS